MSHVYSMFATFCFENFIDFNTLKVLELTEHCIKPLKTKYNEIIPLSSRLFAYLLLNIAQSKEMKWSWERSFKFKRFENVRYVINFLSLDWEIFWAGIVIYPHKFSKKETFYIEIIQVTTILAGFRLWNPRLFYHPFCFFGKI